MRPRSGSAAVSCLALVLRHLCGRWFGGALTMLLAVGLPLLLLRPADGGSVAPLGAFLSVMPLGVLFAALVLGLRASALWGADTQAMVPAYRWRIAAIVVTLGVLLAVAPALAALPLQPELARPGVLKVMLLAGWTNAGAGFLWGFFVTRRLGWPARVALIVLMILWLNLSIFVTVHGSAIVAGVAPPAGILGSLALPTLPAPWDRYHPLTVLALLVGPHNWPWLLARHRGAPLTTCDRPHAFFTNRPVGTAFDVWLWQRVAPLLRLGTHPRREWLVLPAGLIGQIWIGTAGALAVLAVYRLIRLPLPIFAFSLYMAAVASFGITQPVNAGLVARAALLPGGCRLPQVPRWVLVHFAPAVLAGTALVWAPSLLAAHVAGLPWRDVIVVAVALAASAATAGAWQAFSLMRRAGPAKAPRAGIALALPTAAIVPTTVVLWVFGAPPLPSWSALALALAWPSALYLLAARRWRGLTLAS